MTATRLAAKPTPWVQLWQRAQRERARLALFGAGQRKQLGLWSARFYAFGIFVSYAIIIALSRGSERRQAIHALLQAALSALGWAVGGLVALGAASALVPQGARDPLLALARQRGLETRALFRARTLSVVASVARWVAIPGLSLAAVGLARGARPAWALAVAPAIVGYALVVGVLAALLALLAAQLSPKRPRWMLAALLGVPWLMSQAFPAFPTLPKLLTALLAGLLDAGARFT